MRITYARVWMRLIRIESELAGFAFNALLNSHSCRQASSYILYWHILYSSQCNKVHANIASAIM